MKRLVTSAIALLTVGLIASCSSTPAMSIEDGIDWQIRQSAAFSTDFEVNIYTGELQPVSSSSTGMSRAVEVDKDFEGKMAEAKDRYCDRYIDPYGDDPVESQGREVRSTIFYTSSAAVAGDYTDELVAALSDTEAHLEKSGPEVPSFSESSEDERRQAFKERQAMWDEYFEATYSHLAKEREKIQDKQIRVGDHLRTEDGVREVQEAIVEYCEITLPAGFTYPTAEELGIELDRGD